MIDYTKAIEIYKDVVGKAKEFEEEFERKLKRLRNLMKG